MQPLDEKGWGMKTATRRGVSFGVVLLAVIAIAVVPTAASAQSQTFMLVPGIPGSSTDASHVDWIDVFSLQQGWDAATKKQNSCEVQVIKGLDIAGPRLWAAAVTGQVFGEIRIEVMSSGGDRRKEYEVRLANAHITSILTAGAQVFNETVTVTATGMSLFFYPQNPDGTAGTPVTTSIACS
jgi:type VI protein secretion system component Hcp